MSISPGAFQAYRFAGSHVWQRSVVLALLVVLWPSEPHAASVSSCARAVARASATLARTRMGLLTRCNPSVTTSQRPCPGGALARARARNLRLVERACGGSDRRCNGSPDDTAPATIGWDMPRCPSLRTASCPLPISDCHDVATYATCTAETAVDATLAALALDTGGTPSDRSVTQCRRTLARVSQRLFSDTSRNLELCESRVFRGAATGPCPDAPTERRLAKVRARAMEKWCRACGGPDAECGGSDDLTVAAIGFGDTCPDVAPPGGASCAASVGDLSGLVACLDCSITATARCLDASSVPSLRPYPPECGPAPTVVTSTSTPSATIPPPSRTSTPTASPSATPPHHARDDEHGDRKCHRYGVRHSDDVGHTIGKHHPLGHALRERDRHPNGIAHAERHPDRGSDGLTDTNGFLDANHHRRSDRDRHGHTVRDADRDRDSDRDRNPHCHRHGDRNGIANPHGDADAKHHSNCHDVTDANPYDDRDAQPDAGPDRHTQLRRRHRHRSRDMRARCRRMRHPGDLRGLLGVRMKVPRFCLLASRLCGSDLAMVRDCHLPYARLRLRSSLECRSVATEPSRRSRTREVSHAVRPFPACSGHSLLSRSRHRRSRDAIAAPDFRNGAR